jgi:hypothetical protein
VKNQSIGIDLGCDNYECCFDGVHAKFGAYVLN